MINVRGITAGPVATGDKALTLVAQAKLFPWVRARSERPRRRQTRASVHFAARYRNDGFANALRPLPHTSWSLRESTAFWGMRTKGLLGRARSRAAQPGRDSTPARSGSHATAGAVRQPGGKPVFRDGSCPGLGRGGRPGRPPSYLTERLCLWSARRPPPDVPRPLAAREERGNGSRGFT